MLARNQAETARTHLEAAPADTADVADSTAGSQRSGLRLLIGGVILAALLVASFLLPTREILTAVLGWTQSLGIWGPVLLAVVYIVACVLFLPGSILTLGAGALFGLWWGYLAVTVGSVAGASLAFIVGRTIGRGWIEHKLSRNPKFAAIDEAVGREGFKIVLLTRLSPIFPFNLLNYAYGVTRVSFRDYFFASWLGMIPGTLMYVYFGTAAKGLAELASGKIEGGLAQQVFFLGGLLATVVVTVLITRAARRALSHAIEPREQEQAEAS